VILLSVAFSLMSKGRHKRPQVVQAYERFCQRLARIGINRTPQEGPLDYARRASRERPDLSAPISRITSCYIQLRYGPDNNTSQLHHLQQEVQAFHPGRSRRRL
jgi:protein-glutamine gamma-glutamyltransferase